MPCEHDGSNLKCAYSDLSVTETSDLLLNVSPVEGGLSNGTIEVEVQSDIDPELDNNYLKLNIAEMLDFDGDESDGGEEPDDSNGVLGLSYSYSLPSQTT